MTVLVPVLSALLVVLTVMPAARRLAEHMRDPVPATAMLAERSQLPSTVGIRGALVDAATRTRRSISRVRDRRLRRRGVTPDAVASWCDSIASRVRGGTTLREAVQFDTPADQLLSVLTDDLRLRLSRGEPLVGAINRVRQRDRSPTDHEANLRGTSMPGAENLELALSVLGCAAEVGGSPAAPLDSVAAALRLRSADRQERASHSAQATLSAHVLTVVPLGTLGLFIATTPDVRSVLSTSIGASCLLLGLLLNTTGWLWMRRMIGTGS